MRYDITYNQTAHERYDTDVNERAYDAVVALGIEIYGSWGGCMLGCQDDELGGDNGFEVEATPEQVNGIIATLATVIGNPETLQAQLTDLEDA